MKKFQILLLLFIICFSAIAQNQGESAASIRAQMSAIRKSTNWSDAAAAKAANTKIQELAAKLTSALRQGKPQTLPPGSERIQPEEAARIQQENDDYSNKLWNQMMKIVQEGGKGEWDLAGPLREEIVEEYKEDESPKNINPEVLKEVTVLLLDMTVPTVQRTIDVMENFKAIKTLIITGGNNGVPVDLNNILAKASEYPLKNIYIINFQHFVSEIPQIINVFNQLETVALFNNNLKQLPDMSGFANSLDSLFVDKNLISTLFPNIESFAHLKKLGIAQTPVSESEIKQIEKLLPQCTILQK